MTHRSRLRTRPGHHTSVRDAVSCARGVPQMAAKFSLSRPPAWPRRYDSRVHLPIRPIRGRWPNLLESRALPRRFFRVDPAVVLEDDADPHAFREAMSSIYVGGTIKITAAERHPCTDELLIQSVDLAQARIVDVGASDGSTSLDLIRRLDTFDSYTIADLYLILRAVQVGRRKVLFDQDDECVLVVGDRMAAWPSLSRFVAAIYAPVVRRARAGLQGAREVLLLNPEVRRLIAVDPRIDYRVHDVFMPWEGAPPDVIKVANLLRRLYFDDDTLLRALRALRDSLPQGGHLMVVDNPRARDTAPRAGIYRREGTAFVEVARVGDPEIDDLVALVGSKER